MAFISESLKQQYDMVLTQVGAQYRVESVSVAKALPSVLTGQLITEDVLQNLKKSMSLNVLVLSAING